jgi:flagellar basal body-associated protein FliL
MSERERPMSDPPRRRRRRGLVVLLSVIVVVLLAEAGLVVAVFVSPSAGERPESAATSARRAWIFEGEPESAPEARRRRSAGSTPISSAWRAG